MKQLFNIASAAPNSDDLFICELSHYHICLARVDTGGNIGWLQFYEKGTPLTQAEVTGLLQREGFTEKDFKTLLVGSAFPDATLVPNDLAQEKDLKSFLHHQANGTVFVDKIIEQELDVVFSIPAQFQQALQLTDADNIMHVHTAAIKVQSDDSDNYMALHFTSKEFRVIAEKNGEVQLAQIYPFTAPLDVVYYMLMISEQYHLPQSETEIILSGLLDESSALYKEIFQYYTHVSFAKQDAFTLPGTDHPQHFFSSIFNLAACASSVVS